MIYRVCNVGDRKTERETTLTLYLLEDSSEMLIRERPVIVICPGGGYEYLSDREGEIIAMQFTAMGYHAAVLKYSVSPAVYPTALLELGRSVMLLRQNAEEWKIDSDRIIISGFSAGGHLVAGYGMFWSQEWINEALCTDMEILRPNGMILCYPVITSGEFAHEGSFRALLGDRYEEKKESLSLEHCVNQNTPRTFIWHTYEDDTVPVQNSLLLVNELVRQNIPVEFHMFEKGGHGLSLARPLTMTSMRSESEVSAAEWIRLVHLWLEEWVWKQTW